MRVAIATRRLRSTTGASRMIISQVRNWIEWGAKVDVYAQKANPSLILEAGGNPCKASVYPVGKYWSRRLFSYGFDRLVTKGSYDLTVGHGDVINQTVLFAHNLLRREAEVVFGGDPKDLKAAVRMHDELFSRQNFHLCIANSLLMKEDLIRRYRIDPQRVRVVYPGYDPKRFYARTPQHRNTARNDLGVRNEVLIGFVTSGRLRKRGLDILFDTLALLDRQDIARVKVLVVGFRKEVERTLKDRHRQLLNERVMVIEPTREVERLYHALDIFFHPARIEEFGQVVQEAAACGLPVLTSRHVGAAEMLLQVDGYPIVAEPDAELFAPYLAALIDDEAERARCAQQALRAVDGNDWDRYFTRVLQLYREYGLL